MSFTENILPIIYTKKEKQEWEALVSYPIPTLCLFLRHLHYYQKLPDTSNRFIYVHNDFQTVILIIFFFSHGNNTAFTYILYSALESTRNNNFFTHKIFKIASLFPYPDCITQTPEIACLHTNNYISLHI